MAKERIDIEALLEWAYRTQCVDRQTAAFSPRGPSSSPAGSLAQYITLGTRVDTPSFAARAHGLRTPDDADVIHGAVLGLDRLWLQWRAGGDVTVWDRDAAEAAGLEIVLAHGHAELRSRRASAALIAPLETVHLSPLVILHARAGTRPDCHLDWRAPVGARAADGAARDRRGRLRRGSALDFELVAHARALYAVWRASLGVLAAALDGELDGFVVTGPAAPDSPWARGSRRARAAETPELRVG